MMLANFTSYNNGLAVSHELTKQDIEAMIAQQNDKYQDVVLMLPGDCDKLKIIDFQYDRIPKKVILTTINSKGDKEKIKVGFDEAIKIIVPSSTIAKGQEISESQLVEIKFPKARFSKNLVFASEVITGKIAKKNLLAGKVIYLQDVTKVIALEKGKIIKVIYNKGSLNIEAKAVVLQNGGVDDLIEVRNPDSGKVLLARVINSDLVMVDPR